MSAAAATGSRLPAGPLRVHVDETHVQSGQRFLQFAFLTEALVVAEHFGLGAPVDQVSLPVVHAPAGEAQSFETHRFQRDITGQDHQVSPGYITSVFLFDRPQQAARLVQVGVIRPAAERLEALLAAIGAAAAVMYAVGTRAVPGHADHQPAVVTPVRRPPVLRCFQGFLDVRFQHLEVDTRKSLGVVEVVTVWIGFLIVVTERAEVHLFRPPEAVRFGLVAEHVLRLCRRRCEKGSQDGCGHRFS